MRRSATVIGVRGYVTKTVEAWASGGMGSYTGGRIIAGGQVTNGLTPKTSIAAYQVGANYWLSKRTNFYGMFGTNTSSSNNAMIGAGGSVSQAAVGVRHTF
jgi:predicted porin